MTSARSVCMTVSRVSVAGLCGVGSITLSGGKVEPEKPKTKSQEASL